MRRKSDAEGTLTRLRSEWTQTLKDEQVKLKDAEKALKISQDSKTQETRALKDTQAKLEERNKIIAAHQEEARNVKAQVQPLEEELKQMKIKVETLEAERGQAEENMNILQEDLDQHRVALDEVQQRQTGFLLAVNALQSKRSHKQALEGGSSTGGRKDSHQEDNQSTIGGDEEPEQPHSTSPSSSATKLSNCISMNLRAAAANRQRRPSFTHQTPSRDATPNDAGVIGPTSGATQREVSSGGPSSNSFNPPTGPKRKHSSQTPTSEKRQRCTPSHRS